MRIVETLLFFVRFTLLLRSCFIKKKIRLRVAISSMRFNFSSMCDRLLSAGMLYASKPSLFGIYQFSLGQHLPGKSFPHFYSAYFFVLTFSCVSRHMAGFLFHPVRQSSFSTQRAVIRVGHLILCCLFASLFLFPSFPETHCFLPSQILEILTFLIPFPCYYFRDYVFYFSALIGSLDIFTYVFNLNRKVNWDLYRCPCKLHVR